MSNNTGQEITQTTTNAKAMGVLLIILCMALGGGWLLSCGLAHTTTHTSRQQYTGAHTDLEEEMEAPPAWAALKIPWQHKGRTTWSHTHTKRRKGRKKTRTKKHRALTTTLSRMCDWGAHLIINYTTECIITGLSPWPTREPREEDNSITARPRLEPRASVSLTTPCSPTETTE